MKHMEMVCKVFGRTREKFTVDCYMVDEMEEAE